LKTLVLREHDVIKQLIWPASQVEHIARHGITPGEVEEVCFNRHQVIFRAKATGPNPTYYVFGRTGSGRYAFCVIIRFPDGNGYPVTARLMTDREKQRYRKWKGL
jgi:uncharacterized DUF497 family protein